MKNKGERQFPEMVESGREMGEAELTRRVQEGRDLAEQNFTTTVEVRSETDTGTWPSRTSPLLKR